ncbi:hypothetical protein DYI37_19510 [Fulvimarina endophytica]|uniref:Fe/B12 periplasmic-binding domain-containing protein n=1 Tax=Fulvimarina endophytica TaxID=2293836 RepID=A0A371WXU5_9HYPH|nr:ABC transporter substrate-binding protein [Fulvimarina endophytica]RFC61769.1 hypothetical protein DYI37_19510 [Fulvimarina endophytica]
MILVPTIRPLTLAACLFIALPVLPAPAEPMDISDAEPYPALFEPGSLEGERNLVLLGADLVEIAVALGAADRILARPEAIDLPGIGGTPHKVREWAGVEGILSFGPGKITLGSSPPVARLIDGLAALGQETKMISRILPATRKVREMAEILGVPERGEALVASIEADYESSAKTRGEAPRVLHISKVGAGTQFTAGGAETAVDNLIRRVGAVNPAAEVGRDRYRPVTPEGVLAMKPDVVLIAETELPSFGGLAGIWQSYPGLALTPAGRERNVVVMRDLHVRSDAASSGIATRQLADALKGLAAER